MLAESREKTGKRVKNHKKLVSPLGIWYSDDDRVKLGKENPEVSGAHTAKRTRRRRQPEHTLSLTGISRGERLKMLDAKRQSHKDSPLNTKNAILASGLFGGGIALSLWGFYHAVKTLVPNRPASP